MSTHAELQEELKNLCAQEEQARHAWCSASMLAETPPVVAGPRDEDRLRADADRLREKQLGLEARMYKVSFAVDYTDPARTPRRTIDDCRSDLRFVTLEAESAEIELNQIRHALGNAEYSWLIQQAEMKFFKRAGLRDDLRFTLENWPDDC